MEYSSIRLSWAWAVQVWREVSAIGHWRIGGYQGLGKDDSETDLKEKGLTEEGKE